jgi:type I restriction enzyme S subunit
MGNLVPKGWAYPKLKDVVKYQKGKKPKVLEDEPFPNSEPYLDIKAFEKDEIRRYADVDSSHLIHEKEIGIVWDGARSGWVGMNKKGAVGSTIAILRPLMINEIYLFRFLQSKFNYINENTRGSGIPHVDPQVLWDIDFPLPPRAEQDRIVTKVDALMAQHAAIQQAMERIPQLLKDFMQQVLTQAVTGKLTKEWRVGKELEELSQLLESIDKRRKKHKSKKVREINREVRTDLDLYVIRPDWKWLRLEYLMDEEEKFRYGVVQPGNNVDEQKLIRVKDIINEEVDFDSLRGISWEINDKYKSAQVKEGNILVSIVGTIGRTIIIDNKSAGYSIARALAKIPIKDFSSKYIKLFLDCSIGQTWLVGDTREVARKTLNLEQLKTLPVPVPPLQEQQEIVRRVESLFEKAAAIEQRYEQLKSQIDNLPQSILHKAFKGELVEQLDSDGSAMELLEEIEGLRNKTKTKKNR